MSQENNERRKKKKVIRQDWNPHWIVSLLLKIWMVIFSAGKIILGAAATVLMICVICGLVFAGLLGDYLQNDVYPEADLVLEDYDSDASSFIYCINERGEIELLQNVYGSVSYQHASHDEIPQALKDAAVAIEDKRFYEHQGVDWITTVKAFANMFLGDETVGGSSITQQLIKNVTQDDSVTIQRKILEFFRAAVVEKRYDKNTILEAYLNVIFLGNKSRGVKSAAATYFGKEVKMLTIAECASLIGITNNPSIYDPYSTKVYAFGPNDEPMDGRQRNRYRQEIILGQMLEQEYITQEEYDAAMAQELVFKDGIADADRLVTCTNEACGYENIASTFVTDETGSYCPECKTQVNLVVTSSEEVYSWFVDTVLEDVAKDLAARDGVEWNDNTYEIYMDLISRGGYHIYTTLDKTVQEQIDLIYQDLDQIPDTYSGQQLLSGIVVVDNRTGDVVGLAGNVGEKTVFDAFSIATDSKLQSGSSIKPLSVYAPGFEVEAISPVSVVKDLPINYTDGPYPRNDNNKYSYSRTVLSAVVDSVNAAAANTLQMIGTGYSFDFARNKFGLTTLVESYKDSTGMIHSDMGIGPLAMGAQTFGVSLREMTAAFATFASDGYHREARTYKKVYDSEGNVVLDNTQDSEKILSDKTVNYMNYCLVNAVRSGTGFGAAMSGMEVAGKTGSTSSYRDRWFCGFTGYYTAAVWMGYETPEPIRLVNESGNPAPRLWKKVMQPLHEGKSSMSLYSTADMSYVTVCLDSGKVATDACKADVRSDVLSRVSSAYAYWEDIPKETCDKHIAMDYCNEGNGIATQYCKHFAAATGTASFTTRVLTKMTQREIDDIMKAKKYGLNENFFRDDYIYLIKNDGTDGSFKGLNGNINKFVDAPYQACTVHTKEAWNAYAAQNPDVAAAIVAAYEGAA